MKKRALNVDMATVQPNDLVITFIGGDANGDNAVTNADTALIQSLIGTTSGQPGYIRSVDINGNGVIDSTDLRIALDNMGQVGE